MILRSLLYVPGNRPDMMQKAVRLAPDAIILDLEDAVPDQGKIAARASVKQGSELLADAGHRVFVRVNGIGTTLAHDDIRETFGGRLKGFVIPKVEEPFDIRFVDQLLTRLEEENKIPKNTQGIIPITESALGVVNAFSIAKASPRVIGLFFGSGDLTVDMGIEWTKESNGVLYARQKVALDATAAKVRSIDSIFQDFKDEDGLVKDSLFAKSIGYKAKAVIHPSQIGPVNRIFSPSDDEVSWARRVIITFEDALKQGRAATSMDGKMIDTLHYKRAKDILETLDATNAFSERSSH